MSCVDVDVEKRYGYGSDTNLVELLILKTQILNLKVQIKKFLPIMFVTSLLNASLFINV